MTTEQKKKMTCILQRLTYLSLGTDSAIEELMKVRNQSDGELRTICKKGGVNKRYISQFDWVWALDESLEKAVKVQDAFEELLSDLHNIMLEE